MNKKTEKKTKANPRDRFVWNAEDMKWVRRIKKEDQDVKPRS